MKTYTHMKFHDEQVSEHFKRGEFQCRCCGQCPIDPRLVAGLEALRRALNSPVHINSGFRCPKHNQEVGGKPASRHMLGEAADIAVCGLTVDEIADACEEIPMFECGGIGRYRSSGFVHVDVGPKLARWDG